MNNTYNNPKKPQKPKFNYLPVVVLSIPALAVFIKGIISGIPLMVIAGIAVIIVSIYIAIRDYNGETKKYESLMREYEEEIKKRDTEKMIDYTENPDMEYPSEIKTDTSSTPFQDMLKQSSRSEEEYRDEEKNKRHQKALEEASDDAEWILTQIRTDLLKKAQTGQIKIENGKQTVSCRIPLPEKYLGIYTINERSNLLEQYGNAMIGKDMKTNRQLAKSYSRAYSSTKGLVTTFKIAVGYDEIYNLFLDLLNDRAKADGITISKPILFNDSEKCAYTLPYIVDEDACNRLNQNYYIKIKCKLYINCSAIIPEKYSSDVPIFATSEDIKAATAEEYINIDNVDSEDKPAEIEIDDMDGWQFEEYCSKLLTKNGFERVMVTSGSGDQGIDIIAYKDGIKYGIQCKCYQSDIGNKAVQEAYSGKTFYNCHVGVVLTNRYFTRSAMDLAEHNGILLWDRSKLLQMIDSVKGK